MHRRGGGKDEGNRRESRGRNDMRGGLAASAKSQSPTRTEGGSSGLRLASGMVRKY